MPEPVRPCRRVNRADIGRKIGIAVEPRLADGVDHVHPAVERPGADTAWGRRHIDGLGRLERGQGRRLRKQPKPCPRSTQPAIQVARHYCSAIPPIPTRAIVPVRSGPRQRLLFGRASLAPLAARATGRGRDRRHRRSPGRGHSRRNRSGTGSSWSIACHETSIATDLSSSTGSGQSRQGPAPSARPGPSGRHSRLRAAADQAAARVASAASTSVSQPSNRASSAPSRASPSLIEIASRGTRPRRRAGAADRATSAWRQSPRRSCRGVGNSNPAASAASKRGQPLDGATLQTVRGIGVQPRLVEHKLIQAAHPRLATWYRMPPARSPRRNWPPGEMLEQTVPGREPAARPWPAIIALRIARLHVDSPVGSQCASRRDGRLVQTGGRPAARTVV